MCKLWITGELFLCNVSCLHLAFMTMDTFLRLKDPLRLNVVERMSMYNESLIIFRSRHGCLSLKLFLYRDCTRNLE